MSVHTTTPIDRPPAGPPPAGPSAAPARRGRIAVVVFLVLLLIAALATVAMLALRHRSDDRTAAHLVSAPVNGRNTARLDLLSGVASVTVRGADLGDTLYRVGTPDGSAKVPTIVDRDGVLGVRVVDAEEEDRAGGGPAVVDIVVNTRVAWQFRIAGGAQEVVIDLRDVAAPRAEIVDLVSGVSRAELWLPKPSGTVAVRETGGASELTVHAPVGVPVRATLAGGAGSAIVDGAARSGIAGGTVLVSTGWDTVTDRYDIDAAGGLSRLDVSHY